MLYLSYIVTFIVLFIVELAYFRLADKYNIIDKPNQRSSHTQITLRGGGIIFYFAALAYFILHPVYYYFIIGLTLIAFISFLDDVLTISNTIRIFIHLLSISLLSYQIGLFSYPIIIIIPSIIVMIGIINAYNFMDGINGITACYSLSVLALLYIVNKTTQFIEPDFIVYALCAVVVFAFFNFRQKAKCFAGDVGSVSMAFILIFLLGLLIIKTGNLNYILFLLLYGVDTIWTIIRRLIRKDNIFEAHRTHLFQYLANEMGINKLWVSLGYGLLQWLLGWFVISYTDKPLPVQWIYSLAIVALSSGIYLWVKQQILKKAMIA